MTFPEYITAARNRIGWSGPVAAGRIGCAKSTLHSLEHGKSRPTLLMAARIAHAYDVPIEDLAELIIKKGDHEA